MKKILALILTLTIVLTSFAFVSTTVSADEQVLETTVNKLDSVTITDQTYAGDACKRYQRNKTSNRLDLDMSIPVLDYKGADKDYYLVWDIDFSMINVADLNIVGAPADISDKGTNWAVAIDPANYYPFSPAKWNNMKIVWRNIPGSKGIIYVNGKVLRDLNVSEATNIRIRFDAIDASTNRLVYVKSSRILKSNEPLLMYEFDKTAGEDGLNSQLIAYEESGDTETLVGGVFGRAEDDQSWQFARQSGAARIQGGLSSNMKDILLPGYDLILEASVYYPTKETRFDFEGDGGLRFVRFFYGDLQYGKWTKMKLVIDTDDGTAGTADLYQDGVLVVEDKALTNSLLSYESTDVRLVFGGSPSAGYINYFKMYQAPTGTVTCIESKGLTESTTLATGYSVDFENNVIYTTNTVAGMTVDNLKTALGVDNSVAVRAFADTDAKCEKAVDTIADGYKVAIETESGIIQLFTLKQKELSVDENGKAVFNPINPVSGTLIIAAYNSDDTLIKLTIKSVSGADELTSAATGTYYKAFVFDNLTDAKPLVESVSSK